MSPFMNVSLSMPEITAITLLAGSFLFAVYTYIGYPFLLWILSLNRRPHVAPPDSPKKTQTHLLVSLYNEAAVLPAKIENCRQLIANAATPLTVWFISDGSDDGSDEIIQQAIAQHAGLQWIRGSERAGKNAALNLAVETIRPQPDETLVFSDANSIYAPDAVNRLLQAMAPGTGFAVGALKYGAPTSGAPASGAPASGAPASGAATGEGLYWRYESWIKRLESRLQALSVANGAIFALRASYYRPLSPYAGNDLLLPLNVIAERGYGVYVPDARAYEDAGQTVSQEFQRHRRIVNRSIFGLSLYWKRLPAFARFQFISHKLCRWLVFPLQITALGLNACLLGLPFFRELFILQSVFYALVFLGYFLERAGRGGLPVVLFSLNMLNFAALCGLTAYFLGRRTAFWRTIR